MRRHGVRKDEILAGADNGERVVAGRCSNLDSVCKCSGMLGQDSKDFMI